MNRYMKCMIRLLLILIVSLVIVPITAYADEIPALSKSGVMKLTDDVMIGDKQIITVTTRDEHYFYIIIDRGSENENTVHFLNPVDTIDLYAILNETKNEIDTGKCICIKQCQTGNINTECYKCLYNITECIGTENRQSETPKSFDITNYLTIIIPVAIFAVVYSLYCIKKIPEKETEQEYDYDEYENYIEDEKVE